MVSEAENMQTSPWQMIQDLVSVAVSLIQTTIKGSSTILSKVVICTHITNKNCTTLPHCYQQFYHSLTLLSRLFHSSMLLSKAVPLTHITIKDCGTHPHVCLSNWYPMNLTSWSKIAPLSVQCGSIFSCFASLVIRCVACFEHISM